MMTTNTITRERLASRIPMRRSKPVARILPDGSLSCLSHDTAHGADLLYPADVRALVEMGTNEHCTVCGRRLGR